MRSLGSLGRGCGVMVALRFVVAALITTALGCGAGPSADEVDRSMREFQLAGSLREEGNVPGALEHLRRALELYPVLLHLVVVFSNHIHLILTAANIKLLSDFMRYINSNIAREAGRLHSWREKLWGRRFSDITILDDDKMLERAHYLLSHGCKEGLVLAGVRKD